MAVTENLYTGDGSTVLFSFSFPYLSRSEVKVTVDGTATTAFTFPTSSSIQFTTAPANGKPIRIYRQTDIDTAKATFNQGSAIRAADLNNNFTQIRYAAEEAGNYSWKDLDTDTVYSTSAWASSDSKVPTVAAVEDRLQELIADNSTLPSDAADVAFIPDGSGSVARTVNSKLNDVVSVRDFGAVADGDFAGNGTDNTAAFQAAINTGKAVFVPKGVYRITGTLNLHNGYKALIGDKSMPVLVKTTAGPAIEIGATGANLNEYSRLENLYLRSTVTPTFAVNPGISDVGVVVSGHGSSLAAAVQNAKVKNIRVGNWSAGFYVGDAVNCRIEQCFVQLLVNYTALAGMTSSNKFVGFVLDATPFTVGGISPLASLELVSNDVVCNSTPTSVTSVGYYLVGSDIRDTFFDACEVSSCTYGFWIAASGTDFNWNVQIRKPVIDGFKVYGIFVDGADGPGCISINGGYLVGRPNASAAIFGQNSSGISVTGGCQVLGIANDASTDNGIQFNFCYSCSAVGNSIQNCNYGVSLRGSTNCAIVGNHIFASATDTEANPSLFDAIRLFDAAEENVISSNTIRGKDGTDVYSNGVLVSASCPRNVIVGNSIDPTTVTTQYNISDSTTTLVSSAATTIASTSVVINSDDAALTLQGDDGTDSVVIKDGGGTTRVNIRNDGRYQATGRLGLQGSNPSYPIVFYDGAGNAISKIDNSGNYTTGAP